MEDCEENIHVDIGAEKVKYLVKMVSGSRDEHRSFIRQLIFVPNCLSYL